MNKITTIVMFFAVASIPMSMGLQEAFAGTSTDAVTVGTVTIASTCGTTAAGTLDYPGLNVGATTTDQDEREILITNTGNRNVDVIVSATDWTDQADPFPEVMLVGVTHYAIVDNTAYGAQTTMLETGVGTTNVISGLLPQATTTMFHKISIVLVPAQASFASTAEQTETIAFDCPA